jgi:hypothetical protein
MRHLIEIGREISRRWKCDNFFLKNENEAYDTRRAYFPTPLYFLKDIESILESYFIINLDL